jgi:hypothetical protein
MSLEGLIWLVVYALIACAVGGVLTWLIRSAPFIPDPPKSWIVWVIWAVIALMFLLWLVRQIGGGAKLW